MRHRKILIAVSILTGIIIFLVQCTNQQSTNPRGPLYAGATSCAACHKDITNAYAHNNHYKTSSKAKGDSLRKLITPSNYYFSFDTNEGVKLDELHSGFYQVQYMSGKAYRSEPIELAIGSGERAQSFAYWKNGQLFQLPLTYITEIHSWTNSPGFPLSRAYFDRVILSRCFECHASYVDKTDIQTGALEVSEKLDANSIIYGIDCERCHGPAAEHVSFHEKNPDAKQAKFITSIPSLTRQQQLDLCASCHSGNDLAVQRTLFAFRPGDTLANFYYPHFGSGTSKEPDVHGKQMQLLQASKCFQQSQMTCGSCHTQHGPQNNISLFISKCMTCHQASFHALQMEKDTKNCISCHMPLQDSKALDFNDGKEKSRIPYYLTTHKIAIYRDSASN